MLSAMFSFWLRHDVLVLTSGAMTSFSRRGGVITPLFRYSPYHLTDTQKLESEL